MSKLAITCGLGVLAAMFLLSSACSAQGTHPGKTIAIDTEAGARDIYAFTEARRSKHGLPALGVGIIRDGRIIGAGVAGERKIGSKDWAKLSDGFDVASCAKSVTATVAAMLVERGQARWDLTVAQAFPELVNSILPANRDVTLETFLRHRSGLDRLMSTNQRWAAWYKDHPSKTPTELRKLFAAKVLKDQPRSAPGTQTFYCNDGYLVAASMLEKVTGKAWEQTVSEMLFTPLSLKSMRFSSAAAGLDGAIVWGHEPGFLGRTVAVASDPKEYGDPPFGSPGGFLATSIPDMLRYIDFHIQGANGKASLLKAESFKFLHTPLQGEQFALGWEVEATRDAAGRVVEHSIYHGGFSGRARANMWFCPESKTGTVIVYNHGGDDKANAYADIFFALLREFSLK